MGHQELGHSCFLPRHPLSKENPADRWVSPQHSEVAQSHLIISVSHVSSLQTLTSQGLLLEIKLASHGGADGGILGTGADQWEVIRSNFLGFCPTCPGLLWGLPQGLRFNPSDSIAG